MDGLILIIVSLCLIFFALSLKSYYQYFLSKERLKEEIKEKTYIYNSFEKKITRREKIISKMLQYADDFSAIGQRINFISENDEIKKQLMQAGFPYGLTLERFQGLKIFLLVIGAILGGVSLILRLPFAEVSVILLPVAGYLLTILWLRKKARQRQAELSYQLPDFLDTMSRIRPGLAGYRSLF
jgi:tight adherence protein C